MFCFLSPFFVFFQVCALAGESINPRRDVPLSIAYTLVIVGTTYVLSALALSGMVPTDSSPAASSFVLAFDARGWGVASQVSRRRRRGGRRRRRRRRRGRGARRRRRLSFLLSCSCQVRVVVRRLW